MIKKLTIFMILLGISFAGLLNLNSDNQLAYAHSFEPNDLATFLTLTYRAQVELLLATVNFPANVTLTMEHIENADRLTNIVYRMDDDIVNDADFARKYSETLNSRNATIHALVIANIVDQVLKEYGKAFDIAYDLTNMSNMIMTVSDANSSSPSSSNPANYTPINKNSTTQNSNSQLVNVAEFQSAKKLSEVSSQILRSKLQFSTLSLNNTDTSVIKRLEKNMADLIRLVESKASAQELMMLVHGQIHPNLQLAYGLKLKQ
jgi:hypothetical protein